MSACDGDTQPDRIHRLHEAFKIMCSIARPIWREEPGWMSPNNSKQHRWDGSIVALRDSKGSLEVIWRNSKHRGRYNVLAELAWEAPSEPRSSVTHQVEGGFLREIQPPLPSDLA